MPDHESLTEEERLCDRCLARRESGIAPGPWQAGKPFEPGEHTPKTVIAVSAHGGVIAHVNCGLGNGPEHARAIACLPELIAVVQRALAIEDSVTQGQERELRDGYRAELKRVLRAAGVQS